MILYNPTVSGSLLVTGSLTTTGTITSQTLVVQTITSSIEFNTGSTRNGSLAANTHEFTGSVLMSGSIGVGTSSPNRLFTIKNSSDESNGIGFQNYASTAELAYIRYGQNNDTLDIVNTSNFASGGILLKTNNTERMRILANGNVGIGTTSPVVPLQVGTGTVGSIPVWMKVMTTDSTQSGIGAVYNNKAIYLYNNGSAIKLDAYDYGTGTGLNFSLATNGGFVGIGTSSPNRQFVVSNGGAEGLEISCSSGRSTIISYNRSTSTWLPLVLTEGSSNVLIGTTTDSGYKLDVNGTMRAGRYYATNSYFGYFPNYTGAYTWEIGSDASYTGMYFYNNPNGYVFRMTAGGSATFIGGVTSDRRVKENILPIADNAVGFINELKPCSYEFIGDNNNKTRRGFIAQEVLETSIPDLVLGDGEKEGGTYGLDYDGILALAVKAIQEQQAKITSLEEILQRNNIQ
jgi:hypothetical protein